MLKDLATTEGDLDRVRADVLVIGGGIAGLLIASQLAKKGVRVIVLESGSEKPVADPNPLNDVLHVGQAYRGAIWGRSRGLGGTSIRWGGAMLPFLACDMAAHTAGWPIDWPVTYDEVEPAFAAIERIFNLPGGPFEIENEADGTSAELSFLLRSAKWPKFRQRNLAKVLADAVHGLCLEVWLDATVTNFRMGENQRLCGVTARSQSGRLLDVEASFVVMAAGAIESTRLLLLLDAQHDDRIFGPRNLLGRFFFDHLSAVAATVQPFDAVALNETFGLRFVPSGMRDLRIELSPAWRKQEGLPAAFAHLAAPTEDETGFAALRGIYRDAQSGAPVNWRHVARLAGDMGWLWRSAWWRYAKGRLLYPKGSRPELVLVLEQKPNADSTIRLASTARDMFGNRLAQIEWRTSDADLAAFRSVQTALGAWWRNGRFAKLGELQLTPAERWQARLQQDCDIFHPGGTTRMGASAATGVVDGDLRAFDVDNLYVVSTSAFPSGGGANPTFMLMAFALRAAERITRCLALK